MKKKDLEKCLARLRDPNSMPNRYGAVEITHKDRRPFQEYNSNMKMCCVAHCAFVLGMNETAPIKCYPFIAEKSSDKMVDDMIRLMDQEKKSLPEIADWLEANHNKPEYNTGLDKKRIDVRM